MTHVIITGGSSGIGAALARRCLARGDDVSLIARTAAPLENIRASLAAAHNAVSVHAEVGDVAKAKDIKAAIMRCEAVQGPADILIACAGVVQPGLFEQQSAIDFASQVETNLIGAANTVRAVYAGMKQRRQGRILMIGSGAGLVGIYGYTAYCASKYGLYGFAEALRAEAKTSGISVSICFPPDTDTPQLTGELPLRPVEARAIIGAGVWQPEKIAQIALAGLDQGRFAIYPGTQMALLGRLGSLAMPLLRAYFDRRIAKAQAGPRT